jgi:hypothetical protein
LPLIARTPRKQKLDEAEEKAKAKAKNRVKDKDKDNDKDNEEEEEAVNGEEVTNLLSNMSNTDYISHPLIGSTTSEEEEAEVDAVALMPSVMRATALAQLQRP